MLAEELQKPPSDEEIVQLVHNANIDPFQLIDFDKLTSVQEIKALKVKLKNKLKDRYCFLLPSPPPPSPLHPLAKEHLLPSCCSPLVVLLQSPLISLLPLARCPLSALSLPPSRSLFLSPSLTGLLWSSFPHSYIKKQI